MNPLSALLDDLVRRRDEHEARYAAFKATHGVQIGNLNRDEARELFSILLAATRLDCEWTILARLVRGMKP